MILARSRAREVASPAPFAVSPCILLVPVLTSLLTVGSTIDRTIAPLVRGRRPPAQGPGSLAAPSFFHLLTMNAPTIARAEATTIGAM